MKHAPCLLAIPAILLLSACGGQVVDTSTAASAGPRVGIFVDDAFGDGDFFDQAAAAVDPLEGDYDATVTTYEAQLEAANFVSLLEDAGAQNDIVFVLGFEAIDALLEVAASDEDTTFVFVDADLGDANVVSAVFRTQEGCFLAGALAGSINDGDTIPKSVGFIGGVDAPVVVNCLDGFTQGVTAVAPEKTVDSRYVGSFVDPATAKEIAIAMSEAGAFATFQYAGLSGSGAFDAAASGTNIRPIGVVADKSTLAPGLVPGSLLMGVDSAILGIVEQYVDGSLEKGSTIDFGVADGGWSLITDPGLVDGETQLKLDELTQGIIDGTVTVTAN